MDVQAFLEGKDGLSGKESKNEEMVSFQPKVINVPFHIENVVDILKRVHPNSIDDFRFTVDMEDEELWVRIPVAESAFGEDLFGNKDRFKELILEESRVDFDFEVKEFDDNFIIKG
jgi:hypothetical protein